MSVNGPPKDDYESRKKHKKAPSITYAKRTKWRAYKHVISVFFILCPYPSKGLNLIWDFRFPNKIESNYLDKTKKNGFTINTHDKDNNQALPSRMNGDKYKQDIKALREKVSEAKN